MYPTTPDGRYFVVKGQLWRCSNPSLNEDVRQRLVVQLMAARREVKAAKASGDEGELTVAREHVQAAKVVAVGTAVTCRPPHRSVRAELPHTAPASGM